jgi:cyanophycinase
MNPALAVLFLAPLSQDATSAENAAAPKGRLVVVGGGGTPPAVLKRAVEISGGSPRVLVIPQASSRPDAGEGSVSMWTEAGAAQARVLDHSDREAAVRAVEEADLIWMGGGDQNRLLAAFEGTGLVEAIAQRYREGATVGGTSAGAAVLSELTITGEAELDRLRRGATELVPGLGLWRGVIVDQHSLRRGRLNRLIAAVLDHPDKIGVAVDERTAVIVSGRGFEVVGESNVVVLDAREAKVEAGAEGSPPSARDIAMHVLRDGMSFVVPNPN